jgi:hypothetical protein
MNYKEMENNGYVNGNDCLENLGLILIVEPLKLCDIGR